MCTILLTGVINGISFMLRAGVRAYPREWQLGEYKSIRGYLNVHNEMIHPSIEQRSLACKTAWTESNAVCSINIYRMF